MVPEKVAEVVEVVEVAEDAEAVRIFVVSEEANAKEEVLVVIGLILYIHADLFLPLITLDVSVYFLKVHHSFPIRIYIYKESKVVH